ncbi:hypothetical protein, partial [Cupriavidus sp. UYPR2.512]|uniref:hypothetical protein n=1 Tax=Cupriavidus sp. UYPR2.512 TaxID=1080187 RepID=UPI001E49ECEF
MNKAPVSGALFISGLPGLSRRRFDRLVVKRVVQDHLQPDRFFLRAVLVSLIAHIRTLHVQVQHSPLGRTRGREIDLVLLRDASLVDQLDDEKIALISVPTKKTILIDLCRYTDWSEGRQDLADEV